MGAGEAQTFALFVCFFVTVMHTNSAIIRQLSDYSNFIAINNCGMCPGLISFWCFDSMHAPESESSAKGCFTTLG